MTGVPDYYPYYHRPRYCRPEQGQHSWLWTGKASDESEPPDGLWCDCGMRQFNSKDAIAAYSTKSFGS
jgi:hypothetical protein